MTEIGAPAILQYRDDPKVTLLYPPNQSWPGTMCKPNGSLAYPNLGGALLDIGAEVNVYDACVGDERDSPADAFGHIEELPSGLLRTGVRDQRILEEVASSKVVGLTSIFTDQESTVLSTARLIKAAYPNIVLLAGGVNSRHRLARFFAAGVDVVCLSEAESTVQQIVDGLRRRRLDLSGIPGIAYRSDGRIVVNKMASTDVVWDLDRLPIPAWHLLPNDRYWAIGRPHGGRFKPDEPLRYASMMTSLGCVFACAYCHIAGETDGSLAGPIGRFREKSDERVIDELAVLRGLGVKQVFIEDDTLFGHKQRAVRLLRKIQGAGVDILDVNGVNVIHLFRNDRPDREVLEALIEAGFREIVLPFESGSQRIIRKYATNKWDLKRNNVVELVRVCKEYGLVIAGNYMLGYPDETLEEIEQTIAMAARHRAAGLDSANFFLVMPLPGTPLFESALREGHLPEDFDPDRMNWTKATMVNTPVAPAVLEELRERAWRELNDPAYVDYKRGMVVG